MTSTTELPPNPFKGLHIFEKYSPPFSEEEVWLGLALSHLYATSIVWFAKYYTLVPESNFKEGLETIDSIWSTYTKTYGSWTNFEDEVESVSVLIIDGLGYYTNNKMMHHDDLFPIAFDHIAEIFFGQTWESEDLLRYADGYVSVVEDIVRKVRDLAISMVWDFEGLWEDEDTRTKIKPSMMHIVEKSVKSFCGRQQLSAEYMPFFDLNLQIPVVRPMLIKLLTGSRVDDVELLYGAELWDMISPFEGNRATYPVINNYVESRRKSANLLPFGQGNFPIGTSALIDEINADLGLDNVKGDDDVECIKDFRHSYIGSPIGLVCVHCHHEIIIAENETSS